MISERMRVYTEEDECLSSGAKLRDKGKKDEPLSS